MANNSKPWAVSHSLHKVVVMEDYINIVRKVSIGKWWCDLMRTPLWWDKHQLKTWEILSKWLDQQYAIQGTRLIRSLRKRAVSGVLPEITFAGPTASFKSRETLHSDSFFRIKNEVQFYAAPSAQVFSRRNSSEAVVRPRRSWPCTPCLRGSCSRRMGPPGVRVPARLRRGPRKWRRWRRFACCFWLWPVEIFDVGCSGCVWHSAEHNKDHSHLKYVLLEWPYIIHSCHRTTLLTTIVVLFEGM